MAVKSSRTDGFTWSLGAAVADTFQFLDSPGVPFIKIVNLDATNYLWVRDDGVTAVIEADGAMPVPPGNGSYTFIMRSIGNVVTPLSIISAGAAKVCAIKSTRPYL